MQIQIVVTVALIFAGYSSADSPSIPDPIADFLSLPIKDRYTMPARL
jgi:hypothetical protein